MAHGRRAVHEEPLVQNRLVREPEVRVVVRRVEVSEVTAALLRKVELVVRVEHVQPQRLAPVELIVRLAEEVPEDWMLFAEDAVREVRRPAASRHHPPGAIAERPVPLELGGERGDRHAELPRPGGRDRRQVEDAAHAVAVARRKRASGQIRVGEVGGRDDAERVVELLQVIRLVQLLAVEEQEHLVGPATAHVELRGDVVGRGSGQQAHGAKDVSSEMRQVKDVLAV